MMRFLLISAASASLACISCAPPAPAPAPEPAVPLRSMMTVPEFQAIPSPPPDYQLSYGDHQSNIGELRVPRGRGPHPVAILVHGGCWREQYAVLRELGPLGEALKRDGIATWNIEYRRLYEPGSGFPGTYLDVGRGVDHLRAIAPQYNLDLSRVVIVGHSAGGHLAMWAAARGRLPAGSALHMANPLPVRAVVNLAGTMDMTDNIANMEAGCRDTVVTALLGGKPADVPDRYAHVSAMSLLPLGVPQALVWAERDEFVPLAIAEKYARAARQAGDSVQVIVAPGAGHFDLASPHAVSWPTVRSVVRSLLAVGG